MQGFQLDDGVLDGSPDGLEGGDVLSEAVLVGFGEVAVVMVRRVLVGRRGACGAKSLRGKLKTFSAQLLNPVHIS